MSHNTAVRVTIAVMLFAASPARSADRPLTPSGRAVCVASSLPMAGISTAKLQTQPLVKDDSPPLSNGTIPAAVPSGNENSGSQPVKSNLLAQGTRNVQGAWPSPSTQAEPIALRDLNLVRRDLEDLARRHAQAIPPPGITREQMGTFFWQLVTTLAKLPREQMGQADYIEIGRLTNDFEEVVQEVKGKLTMVVAKTDLAPQIPGQVSEEKGREFNERLSVMEKVKVNGDFTFLPQADSGRGIKDTMAANMRARINFQCKVNDPPAEGLVGDAKLFLRLVGASGRFFPRDKYLMSPENDVVDYSANPFNAGINEVQITNLQINNNNSNNVRPTVTFEQAWLSQDLRFTKSTKGNFQIGLNNFSNVFDANALANNETLQFLNTQFVNNIAWRPNFIGPSTIFQVEQSMFHGKAFVKAMSGMISLADRDYFGGFGTNHEIQLGHKFFKKEGNFRAGFWNFNFRAGSSKPFTTPLDTSPSGLLSILPGGTPTHGGPVGCYFNFDQRFWKDIGIFGRYGIVDKQLAEVFLGGLLSSRQAWSIGMELPIKSIIKRRPDDVAGIAFGSISSYRRGTIQPATPAFLALNGVQATTIDQVNANLSTMLPGLAATGEKTLEVYYKLQLNKNISVSPDFQYIWSPGAVRPQPGIFVAGTRLNITF